MFEIIGISAILIVVLYFSWGLIICPLNFLLRLYFPKYDWLLETLWYPIGIMTIRLAKEKKLKDMYEDIDWDYFGHWTYKKYKRLIEERLYYIEEHKI